jgi:hypothetical protein
VKIRCILPHIPTRKQEKRNHQTSRTDVEDIPHLQGKLQNEKINKDMLSHPGGQRHGKSNYHSPRKKHQFVSANDRPSEESQNDVADSQTHKKREGDSGNRVQETGNPVDYVHKPFHCMLLFLIRSF